MDAWQPQAIRTQSLHLSCHHCLSPLLQEAAGGHDRAMTAEFAAVHNAVFAEVGVLQAAIAARQLLSMELHGHPGHRGFVHPSNR